MNMSDFLRNLRSSQKKDVTNRKRNLDGHYYPQTDRRGIPDRRSTQSEPLEALLASLCDLLPQITDTASTLTLNLEQMLSRNGLLVEAKIRQYNAITLFFDHLNQIFSEDLFSPSSDNKPKTTASYATGTHYTKDDILSIIRTMRKKGATFSIIADYLREKDIPTFSGRGEWHAQTIHRLCK